MKRKILVMGLPGAGKTTLTRELAPLLNAVIFNADEVREHINSDLGFSIEDRIEHAKRMGWMCDRVVDAGGIAIADFVCPIPETRAAFGDAYIIWVDRIKEGRFEDTNKLFRAPDSVDFHVGSDGNPLYWAEKIFLEIQPSFNPQRPTALFVGRYQPFHDGHFKLIEEGIRRVGQCCIAVRDTHGIDEKNPMPFFEIKKRIDAAMRAYTGKYVIVSTPNITNIFLWSRCWLYNRRNRFGCRNQTYFCNFDPHENERLVWIFLISILRALTKARPHFFLRDAWVLYHFHSFLPLSRWD